MKNKIKEIFKKILIVGLIMVSIIASFWILTERPTFADSGFSTSHSSSSHSSSHSSSSHSSSRSSGRSSYSSGSHSSGGSSSGNPIAGLISVIFILIIWLIIAKVLSSIKSTGNSLSGLQNLNINEANIEEQIKKYLPTFNKEEFLNQGFKMYCDIQDAWMNFKLEDVKDLITDELYNMYESQLATLEVKGEQNIMKDIKQIKAYLKGVTKQNDNITITTGYVIELYDYIADSSSGKLIRGEANKKMVVTYEMKFRKTLNENAKIETCPNCGAEIKMNSSGICEYCGSKLVADNTKWVLTEKKALNQYYK